jgi:peptidoglycan/LPS O-acetylase OafA/YrhL
MKFSFIQALRGVAALWVVLHHCSEGHHIDALKAILPSALTFWIFDCGRNGVAVFFALSGYVITHSLRGQYVTFKYLGRFIARRAIRLDPPYWTSILFSLVIAAIAAKALGKPMPSLSLNQIGAHLAYLQELMRYPEINTVYWTLTYEVQFYLFLVVSYLVIKDDIIRISALTSLALASSLGLISIHGFFPSLWCAFYVGALAYKARTHRLALGAFVTVFIAMIVRSVVWSDYFFSISAFTAITIAIVVPTIDRKFNQRPLQLLGAISYSLYLTHNPVSGAAGSLVKRFLGTGVAVDTAALLFILASCIAFAILFWLAIERPSQRLAQAVKLGPQHNQSKLEPIVPS